MKPRNHRIVLPTALLLLLVTGVSALALDTELTRRTISGIQGFNVMVEDLQPNIQKYAQKANLTKEQIQTDVEGRLKAAGIRVMGWNDWLKVPGKPTLYINVNTHEYEKYWYAYDIRVEVRQMVSMEANPSVKTLASTWSINMTGIANIGTLNSVKSNVGILVDRFVSAYNLANGRK